MVFRASARKIRLNQAQCLVIKHSVPFQKFIIDLDKKNPSTLLSLSKKNMWTIMKLWRLKIFSYIITVLAETSLHYLLKTHP